MMTSFQLCPDCKGRINPILGICSCGYTAPKQYINHFETREESRKKYIQEMKSILGNNFEEWKTIYDRASNIPQNELQYQFKHFFRRVYG